MWYCCVFYSVKIFFFHSLVLTINMNLKTSILKPRRTESGELVEVSKTSWKGPVSYKCLTSSSSYLEEFRQMYMCASGGNRKGGAAGRTIITSTAEFYLTGILNSYTKELYNTYVSVCLSLN